VSYVFIIDPAQLSDEEFLVLRRIGGSIHVPSSTLDDEQYTRLQWLLKYRRALDLDHPITFNEKIQWLKLRYRRPIMPALVDKIAVRDFVASKIGEQHLNTLYASGRTLAEIELASLPTSFVVKCTHGSAWNVLVHDKATIDWQRTVEQVDRWLEIDYHDLRREWVYRDLEPRVVVERLLDAPSPPGLLDYKVFCFDGRPGFVQVDSDRHRDHRRNLYDIEWRRLPCELRYPAMERDVPRPANLDRMLELAATLSQGFPFVRVDLFNPGGQLLFGEMTFFPGNGFETFDPVDYDRLLGDQIQLPRLEVTE